MTITGLFYVYQIGYPSLLCEILLDAFSLESSRKLLVGKPYLGFGFTVQIGLSVVENVLLLTTKHLELAYHLSKTRVPSYSIMSRRVVSRSQLSPLPSHNRLPIPLLPPHPPSLPLYCPLSSSIYTQGATKSRRGPQRARLYSARR